jgi:membrane protease YdiL (CAAX protease family)
MHSGTAPSNDSESNPGSHSNSHSTSGLPAKHWRLEHVFNLMVVVLFGFGLGGLIYATIAGLRKNSGAPLPAEWSVFIGALSLYGTALPALLMFLRNHRVGVASAFGLSKGSPVRAVLHGVVLAIIALPSVYFLQRLSLQFCQWIGIPSELQSNVKMLLEGTPFIRGLLAVVALGFAPPVEELIFRGVLFPAVRDLGFPRLAFWGTSVLFGLSHFNAAAFLPLTAFGALLAWSYARTGNLLTPWVAHVLFNLAPFLMVVMGWKFPEAN